MLVSLAFKGITSLTVLCSFAFKSLASHLMLLLFVYKKSFIFNSL